MTHEKKEIKIQRRKQSEALSGDVTSEILLRLPPKSVMRFRCVSKLWSTISTDPYFTNSFQTRFSTQPSLLVCIKKGDNLLVLTFPQHNNENPNNSEPIDRYHMRIPNFSFSTTPGDSVNGLICFEQSGKPIIFNPSTRQLVTLSEPEERWRCGGITVFLGYDPIDRKYKVLCLPRDRICEEGRILTLGSSSSAQESWRPIKTNNKHIPSSLACMNGRCINGVLYYIAHPQNSYYHFMMSFDFRSEKFDMIKLPRGNMLINYEGRLACAFTMHIGTELWILEDSAEKPIKWLRKEFSERSTLVHYVQEKTWRMRTELKLKGITDGGEFIHAPSVFHRSLYILIGDSEGNTYRKFEFKGIADDEFLTGNGVECEIRTFPHHIQSLMSL